MVMFLFSKQNVFSFHVSVKMVDLQGKNIINDGYILKFYFSNVMLINVW